MSTKKFVDNITQLTMANENFRKVICTTENSQLVLMSLKPSEEIGEEVHNLDQFIRVEAGEGTVVLDGEPQDIEAGWAVVVPKGTKHNVINGANGMMKLYTLYAPPAHEDGAVHATKAEAEREEA